MTRLITTSLLNLYHILSSPPSEILQGYPQLRSLLNFPQAGILLESHQVGIFLDSLQALLWRL